jgi:hypothetical protein
MFLKRSGTFLQNEHHKREKMHPHLRHARSCLLEGPLGVPDLCDIVTEYAKCWIACAPKGSTFLILGGRNAGKKTLLRDLLHRRSDHYTPSVQVTQGAVDSYVSFLEAALADVWIGHKMCSLRHLGKLVCGAHRLKTDVILCPHNALDIPACIQREFGFVFVFGDESQTNREQLYENFKDYYENFAAFEVDFALATRDFGCLCVDRRNSSVLHFRADPNLPSISSV